MRVTASLKRANGAKMRHREHLQITLKFVIFLYKFRFRFLSRISACGQSCAENG
jgi:hypothetical protein